MTSSPACVITSPPVTAGRVCRFWLAKMAPFKSARPVLTCNTPELLRRGGGLVQSLRVLRVLLQRQPVRWNVQSHGTLTRRLKKDKRINGRCDIARIRRQPGRFRCNENSRGNRGCNCGMKSTSRFVNARIASKSRYRTCGASVSHFSRMLKPALLPFAHSLTFLPF
jgi:hypothetical protein